MNKELRNKIIFDLLVTPVSLILLGLGLSCLIFSRILGSSAGFLGLASCAMSIGSMATNLVFNYQNVCKKAIADLENLKEKEQQKNLDILDKKLSSDREPRDQTALRDLRKIYNSFKKDHKTGKLQNIPNNLLSQIDEIFNTVVVQLDKQFELGQTASDLSENLSEKLLKNREILLQEIESSVEHLAEVVGELKALNIKAESGSLTKLQERLNCQLQVAKQIDSTMQEIGKAGDLSRFSEYQ